MSDERDEELIRQEEFRRMLEAALESATQAHHEGTDDGVTAEKCQKVPAHSGATRPHGRDRSRPGPWPGAK